MTPQKTVAFHTLGCKLNFAETSSIARQFFQRGYQKVSFDEVADVYVINTCSVTENADKECHQIIKKARKTNPRSKVIVVGCYAQLQPEVIAVMEGVDLICGTSDKFRILDHLDEWTEKKGEASIRTSAIEDVNFFVDAYSLGDRTRTFLKIQDGCDYQCAFCTIPMARGRSRSNDISSVMRQVEAIAQMGVKEIILTGVNVGDFGKGPQGARRPGQQLIDLIRALENIEAIERFRISSVEPNLLSEEIIEHVAQSRRFMPHFHIPLQSGSNKILRLMRRRYRRELYAHRVKYIKQLMPHACIGVDVITGFPGETEADFLETYHFIDSLPVSYLHVFTYSERPGTVAAGMKESVALSERKKRTHLLRQLSEKKRNVFYQQHKNTVRKVLFESTQKDGYIYGFTDNYIKVRAPYDSLLPNRIVNVMLLENTSGGDMEVCLFPENYSIIAS